MLMFSFVPAREHRWAMLLGALTATLCLLVADGFFGLFAPNSALFWRYTFPGTVIYWAALLGLPILFRKKVRWRDTWVNFFLYLLLFFLFRPIPHALGIVRHSKYLRFGGGELFSIPGDLVFIALRVSLWLFLIQGFLLFLLEKAAAWREEGKSVKDWRELVDRAPAWIRYGLLMAVLTDIFALFLADGVFGILSPTGAVIFFLSMFIPPFLFYKKVGWLQSGIGFPVHMAAYFLLRATLGPYNETSRYALLAVAFHPEFQPVFANSNFNLARYTASVIWLLQGAAFYLAVPRAWRRKKAEMKHDK